MEEDTIRKQLLEDNTYFRKIIDQIPTQFYFDHETQQKLKMQNSDGMESDDSDEDTNKSKRNKGKKRQSNELSNKNTWKRKKLDPDQIRTVTDLQQQLIESEETHKNKSKKSKKKTKNHEVSNSTNVSGIHNGGSLHYGASSSEDLKDRLHTKLSALQAKRKALGKDDPYEMKKLKRQESKMKLEQRRKADKQNLSKTQDRNSNGVGGTPKMKSPSHKPIYNKEGKMVFSKFDFTDSGQQEKPSDALTGKNYKKLLEKVQKKKEKIQQLKETDQEAAKQLQEKSQWKAVLQKAEGVKVKDKPELLKKALKRKEKLKSKTKSHWEEREKKVKDKMQDRQEKRKTNILKKKKSRQDKKVQKAKKKGRMLPGF